MIRKKLDTLLKNHRVLLIHPIVKDKWIVAIDHQSKKVIHKRLSPTHHSYIIASPNLTIELLLVQVEEFRVNDGKGSWRRNGWSISDRRLVNVLERKVFCSPIDFLMLKPPSIKPPFTNGELAYALGSSLRLAQKMSYCLYKMDLLEVVDKRGRSFLYDY